MRRAALECRAPSKDDDALVLRPGQPLAQLGEFGAVFGALAPVGLAFAPLPSDVLHEQREFGFGPVQGNRDTAQAQFGLDVPNRGPLELLGEAGAGEVT